MTTDDWRSRLTVALADRKLSHRAASLGAGLAPGYVHSLLKEGKDPSVDNLSKVCAAAGISLSFVLFGFEISPATERLMALAEADPQQRDHLLALLEKRAD